MSRAAARARIVAQVALALAGVCVAPAAWAFAEDVCVVKGAVTDCLTAVCKGGTAASAACQANATWRAGPLSSSPPAMRSMIHVDATYFLAVALGYRPDVAYWIAAYDEVVDQGSYVPMDATGAPMSSCGIVQAATINGFLRTGFDWGGIGYHFVTMFSPAGDGSDVAAAYSGLYPYTNLASCTTPGDPTTCAYDPTEHVFEGAIASLRGWAFGGASLACVDGFTIENASDLGSWFTGAPCLATTVTSPLPIFTSAATPSAMTFTAGPLPLEVRPGAAGASPAFTVTHTYADLQSLLDGTTAQQDGSMVAGRLWLGGTAGSRPPVPAAIAELGFYLHVLQDTPSHAYCGDAEAGVASPGSFIAQSAGAMTYTYNVDECTQSLHGATHLEEVGQGTVAGLPLRDYTALDVTYKELAAFKASAIQAGNGDWFVTPASSYTEGQLVGAVVSLTTNGTLRSRYVPGLVTAPLMTQGAPLRLRAMAQAIATAGFDEMPGMGATVTCPQ